MSELVKCGRQLKYRNRIISARTYLLKAGFVEYIEDKNLIITETGKNNRKAGTKLTKDDSFITRSSRLPVIKYFLLERARLKGF